MNKIIGLLCLLTCVGIKASKAQTAFGDELNTVSTAVPFLMIAPDSRAGAMGDAGVASAPDPNSMHWNVAKIAFLEDNSSGIGFSYTPWLSRLASDINLAYLSFYNKSSDMQAFAVSLRYFALGNITFTDETGNTIGQFNPNEFAVDFGYGRKLAENFSMGMAFRYIRSDLTSGQVVGGLQSKPGSSVAADLGLYYQSEKFKIDQYDAYYSGGLNISNVGSKISYTESGEENFIPTMMKFGNAVKFEFDKYNNLTFMLDVSKLLVPTPSLVDSINTDNIGVVDGIFQSFSDAPGGAKEEFREVMWSAGAEYWYNDQFAFRGGYFHEHETKGNRKYFTLGFGVKYSVFNLDFAYLVPANPAVRSPLENTLRFSLVFNFS
ncbi:MAG: hypothetical protein ACI8ZO_000322 [Flavobacteriales bacterium]|jgi:hypothetical protein